MARYKRRVRCLAGIAGWTLSFYANAQTYTVLDLGALSNLPGKTDSGPSSINSAGVVASINVISGVYHGLVFTGIWHDVGTLGGTGSVAGGMNDAGQVAGYSQTGGGITNAFLWTPNGTGGVTGNPQMQNLGTLGGTVSQAFDVNSAGEVTGYSDVTGPTGPRQHAFVYSGGTMKDIGSTLTVSVNSFGYGINSSGHVAGVAYDANYSAPHAFFYDGVTSTDLGLLGAAGCSPLALNNQDTMVGYISVSSKSDHAFSYSAGMLNDLLTLGGNYSYALAINNSNTIVGGSFVDSKDSIYHAFIWSNGSMTDLNTLLDSTGSGWTLVEARAVNDAGQIAGVGTLGGVYHAFRLTPSKTSVQPTKIQSVQVSGSTVVVQFPTVLNQHYALQGNQTLSSANWISLQTNLVGTGGMLSVTNSAAGSVQFYRVLSSP